MVDGKHVKMDGRLDPNPRFPHRSRRAQQYESYQNSTQARNTTRDDYAKALNGHTAEYEEVSDHEKRDYFNHVADGLLPRHHEDRAPRAEHWDDKVYK